MTQTSHFTTRSAVRAASTAKPTLGSWTLGQCVGEGRWARVFQARPAVCPDDWPWDYALKVLRPEFVEDTHAIEMMRREARVGQVVSHPNLVAVLATHIVRPPYYLVTPYLPGVTAKTLVARGSSGNAVELTRPPIPLALWIIRQTAEALRAMHQSGWRHADVKSENVVVSPQGHATLVDLGLSSPVNEKRAQPAALQGTFAYAAPELFASARQHDEKSDLYSLGVVMFELLTGGLPFELSDPCELAIAHLQQPPPDPRRAAPDLPVRIVRFLRRLLSKEPLRRPTAEDAVNVLFALEIEAFDQWK